MGLTQVNNFYHDSFLFCLLNIQTFTFGKLQAEFAALNAAGYAIGDRYCTHKVFSQETIDNCNCKTRVIPPPITSPKTAPQGLFCRRDTGENEPDQLDNRCALFLH